MATVNLTIVAAHIETHPTTGAKTLYVSARGSIGETVVATEAGKLADYSTSPLLDPTLVGETLAATVDDGDGSVTALAYTAA